MPLALWIIVAVLVLGIIAFRALYRSHQLWLERQTPLGAWTAPTSEGTVTLVFEGGPHEGLYKQLVEGEGRGIREFGHWSQHKSSLQMLVMASEIPSNPRIGVNGVYRLLFLTPRKIAIHGLDRPGINYVKVPEGRTFDFGDPA